MRFVPSTDGVELAVHDLGGGGRPLLLAHATGLHGRVWEPLARHLTSLHAWAPDLRGHGDSARPVDGDFRWDGFADDVLAVIDALGLVQPFAAGHSKGGAALLLAEQRRPGTFRGLHCYEPVVFPPDLVPRVDPAAHGETNPLAAGAARRRAVFASYEAAYENFSSKPPFDQLDPAARRAYVAHGFAPQADGTVILKCRPADEAQVYRMGAHHHAFEHLGEIRCNVTVARGAVTPGVFSPASVADAVADALPHGTLEVFDHLGHFGPLESPAEVTAAIERAAA